MKIIDISWPISTKMTQYKDRTAVQITTHVQHAGDPRYVAQSTITLDCHTGTHVDAPRHMIEQAATIDAVPLQSLVGQCRVLDLIGVTDVITAADLQKYSICIDEIVLCKTKNSLRADNAPFDRSFVYLAQDAAQFLVDVGVRAIGFDYLGIEHGHPTHPTHTTLMNNGITIIEGLRLAHIESGSYFFCCLPLLLEGCDAAPARAILVQDL